MRHGSSRAKEDSLESSKIESGHISDAGEVSVNSDLCITVAAVVNRGDSEIEIYIRGILEVLGSHFHYFELLLIDNTGSGGMTGRIEELQKGLANIRLLKLSRTYEDEVAFTAALDHSIGDFLVLMDPNTDPPELVPEFVRRCQAGGLDAVIGTYDRRKEQRPFRRFGAIAFYQLLRMMTGYTIQPNTSHFRVLSRRIVNAITRIKDKERYIKYLTEYVGYKHGHVPYDRITRMGASQQRGLWRSFLYGIGIIVTYSDKPLRLLSFAGVTASFVSFLYIAVVLLIAFFEDTTPRISAAEGWAATNAFTAGMFFLLFCMLAVLSEYVLKVLNETQQRPLYHVAYETNSVVLEAQGERVNVV